MRVHSLASFAKLMLLGALGFWIPGVIWHAATTRKDIPGLVALAVPTVSMPLCLLGLYLFLKRRSTNKLAEPVGPALMLGIWTLGGLFMAIGASFEGGGFVGSEGFKGGIEMTLLAIVPVYTFVIATYEGSLGALILASLVAIAIALLQARSSKFQPLQ